MLRNFRIEYRNMGKLTDGVEEDNKTLCSEGNLSGNEEVKTSRRSQKSKYLTLPIQER